MSAQYGIRVMGRVHPDLSTYRSRVRGRVRPSLSTYYIRVRGSVCADLSTYHIRVRGWVCASVRLYYLNCRGALSSALTERDPGGLVMLRTQRLTMMVTLLFLHGPSAASKIRYLLPVPKAVHVRCIVREPNCSRRWLSWAPLRGNVMVCAYIAPHA